MISNTNAIALQSHTLKNLLVNARSITKDVSHWMQTKPEYVPVGIASIEAIIELLIRNIDIGDLLTYSDETFKSNWENDKGDLSLNTVVSEAVIQAILRLTVKEFSLTDLYRKIERVDVNNSLIPLISLDLNDQEVCKSFKNGFNYPFDFIKIQFDEEVKYHFDKYGIRRSFFYAVIHELAFNAIKYDAGTEDIFIRVKNEEDQLVIIVENSYAPDAGKRFKTSGRGKEAISELVSRIDAKLTSEQSEGKYCVKLTIPKQQLDN